jgi:hypothetical protein
MIELMLISFIIGTCVGYLAGTGQRDRHYSQFHKRLSDKLARSLKEKRESMDKWIP